MPKWEKPDIMSRNRLAGIIIACTIAIIVVVVITRPSSILIPEATPTQAPTESTQQFDVDNDALDILDTFLTCATNGDIDGMWISVCPESRAQYRDAYDFKWMNGVYSKDGGNSLLVAYEIENATSLSVWNGYSDVVEVQTTLKYRRNPPISVMEGISGIDVPLDTDDKTWITHLIKVDDSWDIVCDSINPLKFLWYKSSD
jgi:hypothetical protein